MPFFRRKKNKPPKQKSSPAKPKSVIKNKCDYCGAAMELTDRWCPVCDRDSRWDEEEELDNW